MPIYLPTLKRDGRLAQTHITYCIVGSRKGDTASDAADIGTWNIFAPNLTIYGFEADPEGCAAANAQLAAQNISWTEKHFPVGLWSSSEKKTLYVTKNGYGSSLFEPAQNFIDRYAPIDWIEVIKKVEIDVTSMDEFFANPELKSDIDFIQIDTQGAELPILEGAKALLSRGCLGIRAEVEWLEMYRDQPHFGDIDVYLRGQGYSLFGLSPLAWFARRDIPFQNNQNPGGLAWSNALFLRDLLNPEKNHPFRTPERIFKLACIADVLDYPDYATELLVHLTVSHGSDAQYNFADLIIESLSQIPALAGQGISNLPFMRKILPFAQRFKMAQ
jgi:FkbM family methyltransferase